MKGSKPCRTDWNASLTLSQGCAAAGLCNTNYCGDGFAVPDEIMMEVLENESPSKCVLCSDYIRDCVILVQYLSLWFMFLVSQGVKKST